LLFVLKLYYYYYASVGQYEGHSVHKYFLLENSWECSHGC